MASDDPIKERQDAVFNEALSAFLDGESERDEVRFLIRRLEVDRGARAALERFALIGACLRGELSAGVRPSIADRVAATLAAEERARVGRLSRWWRWPAGLAIAATVAGIALLAGGPAPPLGEESRAAGLAAVPAQPSPVQRPERAILPTSPALLPDVRTVSWVVPERRPPGHWPLVAEPPAYLRLLRVESPPLLSVQEAAGVGRLRPASAESPVTAPPQR